MILLITIIDLNELMSIEAPTKLSLCFNFEIVSNQIYVGIKSVKMLNPMHN